MNDGGVVDVDGAMLHRPYPKIEQRPAGGPAPAGAWVALEKIHGAHFVVGVAGGVSGGVSGGGVFFGKRKAWLGADDVFFGWQLLRHDIAAGARAIASCVADGDDVFVYGELFGGRYPHGDVAAVVGAQPVQTGVWYCPDVRWAVFDVVVGDEFVDHDDVVAACAAAGVLTPPLLHRGPRSEVERHPVRFASRVPALLGLPPLADNLAEGFVAKPVAGGRPASRPQRKHKRAAFSEDAYDGARPFDAGQRLSVDALRAVVGACVNDNRVASARSKVGEDGDVVAEVVIDVVGDIAAAYPAAVAAVGEDVVADLVADLVAGLVSARLTP